MTDVFISYSRKDIAFARLLHEALVENESGNLDRLAGYPAQRGLAGGGL